MSSPEPTKRPLCCPKAPIQKSIKKKGFKWNPLAAGVLAGRRICAFGRPPPPLPEKEPLDISLLRQEAFRIDNIIHQKYRITEYIAAGSHGVAFRAVELPSGNAVVLKVSRGLFEKPDTHAPFYARALAKEAKFLEQFKHSHIVQCYESFTVGKRSVLALESLGKDLFSSSPLPLPRVQEITRQLLETLSFLEGKKLVLSDLKPANLCMRGEHEVVAIDMASALPAGAKTKNGKALEVQTLSYRAPEILLGSDSISLAADRWSLSCTLFKLYTGKTLFGGMPLLNNSSGNKGGELNYLLQIISLLGEPPQEMIAHSHGFPDTLASTVYHCESDQWIRKEFPFFPTYANVSLLDCLRSNVGVRLKRSPPPAIAEAPPALSLFADFLSMTLKYDPMQRASIEELQKHPFMTTELEDPPRPFSTGAPFAVDSPPAKRAKTSFDLPSPSVEHL